MHVDQVDSIDEGQLWEFLAAVKFRNFNMWPRVTESGLVDFLASEILIPGESQKIFLGTEGGKVHVLLLFQDLPWDTQHFGVSSGRIKFLLTNMETDSGRIQQALDKVLNSLQTHCTKSAIRFVAADIDSWKSDVTYALQKAGFRYIVTWIDGVANYSGQFPELPSDAEVGLVKSEELEVLSALAAEQSFKGGRFYLDHRFDRAKVDDMYGKLVYNSFQANDIMLVYRVNNKPVGLFICKKIVSYAQFADLRVAPLRYLCVDPEYRNRNIGLELYTETIRYLRARSDLITTGLEIHNAPSTNLHSKLGFRFNYVHNAFHWWNDAVGAGA